MPLFQPAPATPEEMEKSRPLELSPDKVAELDEEAWYEEAYRGDDAPQLTARAVGMGVVLGFFLAFTNVYLGLKIGWHFGVALSACILSFSIWGSLHKAGIAKTPMTILENTCMASTASAAGYATGGTLVSAIPALFMLTGKPLPWAVTAAWVFFLAVLGTCLAIPMKRNMINQERLKFPSGTAAAELLRSLYSEGEEGARKARALLYAALASGALPLLKDLEIFKKAGENGKMVRHALLPGALKIFDVLPGISAGGKVWPLSSWNMTLDYSAGLIAAGALVGLRATISMVVGGCVLAFYVGPMAVGTADSTGKIISAGTAWKDIGVWVGAPILVSSGLLSFAFQWKTIVRAFTGFRGGGASTERSLAIEAPTSWFAIGVSFSGVGIVAVAQRFFDVPVHFGVLAVLLTFVLALVACRATGETDITPTGPMGKIMQLTYGMLMRQNASANLMTAGITAGASAASADLLTDLKSGYLLGANPRRQFIAQLMGLIPGTVATVLCYAILVPNMEALTGGDGRPAAFPAPAAQQWLKVAQVFQSGIASLHPVAQRGIFWGLFIGVALVLLERAFPKQKKYLPSATGIGLGLLLLFYQSIAMFLGAAIAAIASRDKDSRSAQLVVPVASGLIVGESIVGVVVTALNNFVLNK